MKGLVNFGMNNAAKSQFLKRSLIINNNKENLKAVINQRIINQRIINNNNIELNLLKVQCIEKTANTYNISNNNVKYLVIIFLHFMLCISEKTYKKHTIIRKISYKTF